MNTQPQSLYRARDVRMLDRQAIEVHDIPGLVLMNRAGYAAFRVLRKYWPDSRCVVVCCGTGNNGGDGFVVARLLRQAGFSARAGLLGEEARLGGDALAAAREFSAAGGAIEQFAPPMLDDAGLIVDALLGTGLDREVSGKWGEAITAINHANVPVLSVDVPSGLNADSGRVMGCGVAANVTVTFIGMKQGMLTGEGPDHCGAIEFDDLQVPAAVYEAVAPSAIRFDLGLPARYLGRRRLTAHKGDFGHVLVIGGDHGMAGAARMAGEAAVRVGAGLVSVATRSAHAAGLNCGRPELMCHGIETLAAFRDLLGRASVLALGPGLGRSDWSQHLLGAALESTLPMVVDADGLNLLAAEPCRREHWILTPHPGEAGRLLGCSAREIQNDRYAAVQELVARYGGTCILKGAGTLVASGDAPVMICEAGNPGMSSGGMGDVLTGVVAGLVAQQIPPTVAAQLAVWLHGRAADEAAGQGERGMCATDLLPFLRRFVNPDGH